MKKANFSGRAISLFFAAIFLSIPVFLSQCSSQGAKPSDEILIGFAAPLTGDNSQFGTMMKKGVELMVKELNAAGGVNKKKVVIQYEDDKADPKEAANVAQKLCSTTNLVAVVGHFNSSCSLAGKGIYKQNHVVQISPGSTNDQVCVGSGWTFRDVYRDDFQGFQDAVYAKNQLQAKKVAVMYDNDDYGSGLKNNFEKKAKEIGLNIVGEEAFNRDTQDFTPQLTSLYNKEPDLLFVSGLYTQGALVARQARKLSMMVPFLGADGLLSVDLIKLGGPAVEGLTLSCPFLLELGGPKAKEFSAKFKEAFNIEPDAWSALSYDALGILAEAIRRSGKDDSDSIREAMRGMNSKEKGYSGVTGLTVFDGEGDCLKPLHYAIVKGGKFVPAPKQMMGD